MAIEAPVLRDSSNTGILQAIRAQMSPLYQSRIPDASKASQQDTFMALTNYKAHKNEFLECLVNQIGMHIARQKLWNNPMAFFKTDALIYGDTIEETYVDYIKARVNDADRESMELTLFGTHTPNVQANFHRVNQERRYDITVRETDLARAFRGPEGLSKMVSQILTAPTNSDSLDEFLLTCQLFSLYENAGGFFKVQVPDVKSPTSTPDDARAALRFMREVADTIKFPSRRYNAAGVMTHAQPEELVIFMTPAFKAAIDVEALAGAFNMEKLEAYGRIILVPEENFAIDGCQAIITTEDFFIIADQLLENSSQYNASKLQTNFFLHHWQLISASRFAPAVMFTTKPGTDVWELETPVTDISALLVTDRAGATIADGGLLTRGELYNVFAEAITTPGDGYNKAVRYTVTGAESPSTYVTQNGVLHVGGDETGKAITVTAITTWVNPDNTREEGFSTSQTFTPFGLIMPQWPVPVEGVEIMGVMVPDFDPAVLTYSIAIEGSGNVLNESLVVVVGPGANFTDVEVSNVTATGGTVTLTAYKMGAPVVYTITVTDPA